MQIYLKLPKEVEFGSQTVKCYGAQGTDTIDLDCETQPIAKRMYIKSAF